VSGARGRSRIRIGDASDPRLDPFRGIRDRELRGDSGLFMAESARVVGRLLASRYEIDRMLLSTRASSELEDAIAARAARSSSSGIEILEVPDGLETEIAGARFHGGALAIGRRPRRPPSVETLLAEGRPRPRRLLLLEGVTHPDNVGSIFRSAACLGGCGVILDGRCADPLLRPTIRFSMGRVFSMPWTIAMEWNECLASVRSAGFTIVAAETTDGAVPPREMPRDRDLAILLGSEGHGLSQASLEAADRIVRISSPPGSGEIDGDVLSLNVAVASAILLHELAR
jgi:tRNA G18 (ribose-2'-O)-methylase SpoU